MIIINLKGGLGNQLFQYASGLHLAKDEMVYFDLSYFKKNKHQGEGFQKRAFELSLFKKVKFKLLNTTLLKLCLSQNYWITSIRKILPFGLDNLQYINEENIGKEFTKGTYFYLQGYFQDPKIFENIRSIIISRLQFPKLPRQFSDIEKKISSTNAVSLHVRRGDYLDEKINEYHGILPLTYYQKSVKIISEKTKNPHFFIFSDDVDWCKDSFNFIEHKTVISDRNAPHWVDMYLMTKCNHHIIANSTFSWWGAWLNENEDKIVIAPKNWFLNEETKILPKEWIKV